MSTYLLITPSEDELYHHGIKGQKWGIRRFQPYLPGSKVKGGKEVGKATKVKQRGSIVEHFKAKQAAHKKSAAVKKAQATRKANIDYEAAKKKAIESGTVEDLAKFKGKLTNEEYTKAFLRLQNEKKMAEMVAANQKSAWDMIDSGMKIVERVGKYAGTIATRRVISTDWTPRTITWWSQGSEARRIIEKITISVMLKLTNLRNLTIKFAIMQPMTTPILRISRLLRGLFARKPVTSIQMEIGPNPTPSHLISEQLKELRP